MTKNKNIIVSLGKNVSIVAGIVLIWRGIWYTLDKIDLALFGGSHAWTAIGGIILGLIILYIPDGDWHEIEKL
ncbi:MAG: hypothetical protein COV34_01720 [Candidatus Zambryskibacteria bacterium CG10_big_fil_rev_8_21_14_0_10_42_12]|uniref:Uncharacterized protein n=1 Tax=Candidatus Zambryskibacteria bacterium CG10_big_fil_rev_8_21_14_0_10_42_12 TaxID=1975115 RepID=A0A2H0QWG2_9BACT|nr:MAG: hypothetical protein COV34_01720 [Candidatus Zambryskibacteria bacterium CG10_big_fil_rev_8_21_14_0_10_42_12]